MISALLFMQICCELNQSSLRRVREWGGPKGEWRWQVSEEPAGHMFQVKLLLAISDG